jgi:hypothetical protein
MSQRQQLHNKSVKSGCHVPADLVNYEKSRKTFITHESFSFHNIKAFQRLT